MFSVSGIFDDLISLLIKSNRITKINAAQNEVALSYHRVRGLYFLVAVFAETINTFLLG